MKLTKELLGKLCCENYGVHCLNNAVGECDLGDGKGVKFYCRKCMENVECDPDDWIQDESLVFCQREWEQQG